MRRSSRDLKKNKKKIRKQFFFYLLYLNELVNLRVKSPWKQKQDKIFQSRKKLKHFIHFETLYSFRDIVFILRHCIYFETLYLIRDIVFNSRYCIISRHSSYFETARLFALSIRARRASTSVPRAESRSRRRRFSRPERRKKLKCF